MRFTRQLIRAVILGLSTAAFIFFSVAAFFFIVTPPRLQVAPNGNVDWHVEPDGDWDLRLWLNGFRDTRLGAMRREDSLRLTVRFKREPVTANELEMKSFGPIRFFHFVLAPTPTRNELARKIAASPPEARARDALSAEIVWLEVPPWLPAPLFAAYPLWAFVRGPWRRRRRKANGLCIRCGYDLTGNVSGVCSECGRSLS